MTQLAAQRSNPALARPLLESLKIRVPTLSSKTEAAGRDVSVMYHAYNERVSAVKSRLQRIEWTIQQLAEASFQLLATESVIMAVKAVWCKDVEERPEDPEGVLYLTDQRLIFEQKEEIATKKVLFITTAKEKVQALKWEAPVAPVEEVKSSKQGLLRNEDHLDIRFGPGAPLPTVHLHIWQEGSEWVRLINRAKSRDFDRMRTQPIDEAAQEKVKSAPTRCPSCGATITQVVLRGMDSIQCEYCGYVIRL
jgi:ribosomal protein S27AE